MKRIVLWITVLLVLLGMFASVFIVFALGIFGGAGQKAASTCISATTTNSVGSAPGNATLLAAIKADTAGNNELTASMIFGSAVESNLNPSSVGLGGGFGAFQIQEPGVVHPDITQVEALNAAYATNYMLPVYENALQYVNPSLWTTNPMLAMENTAVSAERPEFRYDDYAHNGRNPNTVQDAYNLTLRTMQQLGVSTVFSTVVVVDQTKLPVGSSDAAPASSADNSGCDPVLLADATGATGTRATVIAAANTQLGVPYSYGGGNTAGATLGICIPGSGFNDCNIVGFDCSGLTLWAYNQIGISFPHNAALQWNMTRAYTVSTDASDLSQAQPGDLVFFSGSDGTLSSPGHVGIYLGDGLMIDAPQSGENVQVTNIMTPFWENEFVGVTDPFAYESSRAVS